MLLNDAVLALDAVKALVKKEIPISLAFRLEKIAEVLQPDVTRFYELRNGLIKEKGEPVVDEQGNVTRYILSKENQDYVNKEIDNLTQVPVAFPEEYKISLSSIENVVLEGTLALSLKSILKD